MRELSVAEKSTITAKQAQTRAAYRSIAPALLLALYVVQCAWFIRTQSLTYDEPVHIAEGLDALRNGRFEQYNDHPPLARLLCALPLLDSKWQVQVQQLPQGFEVHRISPDPVSLAWRARAMNVALGVLLGILLWLLATELFSRSAANFALALFAFSPSLIAHFSLATTDGAATLLIFATAFQIIRWKRSPNGRNAVICGIVLGLLLLAKFSTVSMFVLALGWLLLLTGGTISARPWRWNWITTVAILAVAFIVVWAGYFFHVSHLTIRDGTLTVIHPNWSAPYVKATHSRLHVDLSIPAGEFIAGFRDVALHNAHGQPAFFLGQVSPTGGWKLYYPVAILLKWPLIALALACCGFLLMLKRIRSVSPELWIVFSFPAVYFVIAIFAHFNLGERHVLPLYPFALLCVAYVWQQFTLRRAGMILLIVLAFLNAADALRYAPDYLAYFDIAVPRAGRYRLLTDSNLDWGQGLLALRDYERAHPGKKISLIYFGSVDPALYGIRATRRLPEQERATGNVVISATELSGQYLRNPDAYRWLLRYRPTAVLDGSMYVYRIESNETPK